MTVRSPGTAPALAQAGKAGASAYEVAVVNGFVGTQQQWLASLIGAAGAQVATGHGPPSSPGGPHDLYVDVDTGDLYLMED